MNGKLQFTTTEMDIERLWGSFVLFSHQQRQTIVRQDERPANFYIILSGSAIPTYKRATDGTIETLDVLKRGSTFGVRILVSLVSDPSF
jgi:CRP-like cAMP-binding protein